MGGDSSLSYSPVEGVEVDDSTPAPTTLPPGVAPEDGLSGGQHRYNLKPVPYALPMWSEESKVSCSKCDWHLEDAEWCCDHDCNQAGPHYRNAYVCKDPSDPEGKITANCDAQNACRGDAQPIMCSTSRLLERQKEDTRKDPACVKRNGNKTDLTG